MGCFSWGYLEQLLIWLIIAGAIIALIRLVLPLVLGGLGVAASTIVQAVQIVFWAVIAIILVIFIFSLIACLAGHFPAIR